MTTKNEKALEEILTKAYKKTRKVLEDHDPVLFSTSMVEMTVILGQLCHDVINVTMDSVSDEINSMKGHPNE